MLEVNARAERLDYANAQMAAARAELRALDNQLVIVSNQLVTTQQDNAQISEAAATRAARGEEQAAAARGLFTFGTNDLAPIGAGLTVRATLARSGAPPI